MNSDPLLSWNEPSRGTHAIWAMDPWRYPKLFLIPGVLLLVGTIFRIGVDSTTVGIFICLSAFFMLYLWVWSFMPRLIRVFRDRVQIARVGRGVSWKTYAFENAHSVEVEETDNLVRITIIMDYNNIVVLHAPDLETGLHMQSIAQLAQRPNKSVDPTTTAVTPPAGQEPRHQ